MSLQKVRVQVPASTANLGPGFDTLGMALNLYAWIEMGFSDQTKIHLLGEQLKGIPDTKSNLIYKVAQMVFDAAGESHPELEISMYSDIPLTRGLGSSASAIVGGMVAANALIQSPLSLNTIFQLATRLENHPDNVGASLFGGLVVSMWDGLQAQHLRIALDAKIEVLVVIPDFQLSTEVARNALPSHVSMKEAVFNVGHSSLLVAALAQGDLVMIKHAMKDRLHQPYRMKLVPGMEVILQGAVDHGALGCALSGAGPTLLALVDPTSQDKAGLESFFLDTLDKENIKAETLWLKPSLSGARVLTQDIENSTFIENIKGVRI